MRKCICFFLLILLLSGCATDPTVTLDDQQTYTYFVGNEVFEDRNSEYNGLSLVVWMGQPEMCLVPHITPTVC